MQLIFKLKCIYILYIKINYSKVRRFTKVDSDDTNFDYSNKDFTFKLLYTPVAYICFTV